jgi:hypothetical protein
MRNGRRRTWVLIGPAAAAVAVGVALALRTGPLAPPPAAAPSRANFDRLREGMSLAGVEAALGPAGFDLSSDTRRSYFIWKGPDGWARVWLAGDPRTVRRLAFDPTLREGD